MVLLLCYHVGRRSLWLRFEAVTALGCFARILDYQWNFEPFPWSPRGCCTDVFCCKAAVLQTVRLLPVSLLLLQQRLLLSLSIIYVAEPAFQLVVSLLQLPFLHRPPAYSLSFGSRFESCYACRWPGRPRWRSRAPGSRFQYLNLCFQHVALWLSLGLRVQWLPHDDLMTEVNSFWKALYADKKAFYCSVLTRHVTSLSS